MVLKIQLFYLDENGLIKNQALVFSECEIQDSSDTIISCYPRDIIVKEM